MENKIKKERTIIMIQRIVILAICAMYFYLGSKGYFCSSSLGLVLLFFISVITGEKTHSNIIDPRVYHFLLEAAAASIIVILIIVIGNFSWLYLGGWLFSLLVALIVRAVKYPRNISVTENDFGKRPVFWSFFQVKILTTKKRPPIFRRTLDD